MSYIIIKYDNFIYRYNILIGTKVLVSYNCVVPTFIFYEFNL